MIRAVSFFVSTLSILLLYLNVSGRVHADDFNAYLICDTVFCVLFAAEFFFMLSCAKDRRRYFRTHLVDLVAATPLLVKLRFLRLFSMFRILRAIRSFALFTRFFVRYADVLKSPFFRSTVVVVMLFMLVCAVVTWDFERGTNKELDTIPEALWWAVVTITTVGYGDIVPQTTGGRVTGVILMIIGIGVFSAMAGGFARSLIKNDDTDTASLREEIRSLRAIIEKYITKS